MSPCNHDMKGLASVLGGRDEKAAAAGDALVELGGPEVADLLLATLQGHPNEGARFHLARVLGDTIERLGDPARRQARRSRPLGPTDSP